MIHLLFYLIMTGSGYWFVKLLLTETEHFEFNQQWLKLIQELREEVLEKEKGSWPGRFIIYQESRREYFILALEVHYMAI